MAFANRTSAQSCETADSWTQKQEILASQPDARRRWLKPWPLRFVSQVLRRLELQQHSTPGQLIRPSVGAQTRLHAGIDYIAYSAPPIGLLAHSNCQITTQRYAQCNPPLASTSPGRFHQGLQVDKPLPAPLDKTTLMTVPFNTH